MLFNDHSIESLRIFSSENTINNINQTLPVFYDILIFRLRELKPRNKNGKIYQRFEIKFFLWWMPNIYFSYYHLNVVMWSKSSCPCNNKILQLFHRLKRKSFLIELDIWSEGGFVTNQKKSFCSAKLTHFRPFETIFFRWI